MQTNEHAEMATERITQAVRGANVESGLSGPTTAEEFRTILRSRSQARMGLIRSPFEAKPQSAEN